MPHLAFETFFGQIFWLIITFVVLYNLVSKLLLPNVAEVVDARENNIMGNVNDAEKMKNTAQDLQEKYEAVNNKATLEARKTLEEALKKTDERMAEKRKEVLLKIDKSLRDAEKRIAKVEAESADVVESISGEIAKTMAKKLVA